MGISTALGARQNVAVDERSPRGGDKRIDRSDRFEGVGNNHGKPGGHGTTELRYHVTCQQEQITMAAYSIT